jgi:hypothetical protein
MSRRDPHPVDPTRRTHIEDPDEYERGRRDGQPVDPGKKPEPPKYASDRGDLPAGTFLRVTAVVLLVVLLLAVCGVI